LGEPIMMFLSLHCLVKDFIESLVKPQLQHLKIGWDID